MTFFFTNANRAFDVTSVDRDTAHSGPTGASVARVVGTWDAAASISGQKQ